MELLLLLSLSGSARDINFQPCVSLDLFLDPFFLLLAPQEWLCLYTLSLQSLGSQNPERVKMGYSLCVAVWYFQQHI